MIYQQTRSFLPLCQILYHYKSLTHSKSMHQKRNHDFTGKYPYIRAGTFEPMRINDILIGKKLQFFAVPYTSKAQNDIEYGKGVKTILVVDTSQHSLTTALYYSSHL